MSVPAEFESILKEAKEAVENVSDGFKQVLTAGVNNALGNASPNIKLPDGVVSPSNKSSQD